MTDVENAGLVDRRSGRLTELEGPQKKLVECFSCRMFWISVVDILFCWPRHLCSVFRACRCCPEVDCKCVGVNCSETCRCSGKATLRKLHIVNSIFSAVLAAMLMILTLVEPHPERLFNSYFTMNLPGPAHGGNSVVAGNTTICNTTESLSAWLECLDEANETATEVGPLFGLQLPYEHVHEYNPDFHVVYYVFISLAATAIFRAAVAGCLWTCYKESLERFVSFTWLFEALPLGIFVVATAQYLNLTDVFLVSALAVVTILTVIVAGAIDFVDASDWIAKSVFVAILASGVALVVTVIMYFLEVASTPTGHLDQIYDPIITVVSMTLAQLFGIGTFVVVKALYLCFTARGACGKNSVVVLHDEEDKDVNCCWRCCFESTGVTQTDTRHEMRRRMCMRGLEAEYLLLSMTIQLITTGSLFVGILLR